MGRKLSDQQLNQLVYRLNGTSDSLSYVLESLFDLEEDDLHLEDFHAIDEEIFCCELCGWWQEISCMAEDPHDQWICEDCFTK